MATEDLIRYGSISVLRAIGSHRTVANRVPFACSVQISLNVEAIITWAPAAGLDCASTQRRVRFAPSTWLRVLDWTNLEY